MQSLKFKLPDFSSSKMNFFMKIFIPVLATLLMIVIIALLNFHQSKELSKKNSLYSMETFSLYCESSIKNAVSNCKLLESDTDILRLLNQTESFTDSDGQMAADRLKRFIAANNIIYSAAIINKAHNEVASQDGLFSAQEYFNDHFILSGYTDTYWSNFRIYTTAPYKILPPVYSEYQNNKIPVIPIIFRELSAPHDNYLLITLSLVSLAKDSLSLLPFSENAELYILNRYTGSTFNITNGFEMNSLNGTDMYYNLMKDIAAFDVKNSSGNKAALFSYSSTDKILGYTYYAIVPYHDINKTQLPNIIITSLIFVITLIVTLILTNKNVNDYFVPIQKMETVLGKNIDSTRKKEKNHVHNIADAVSDVVSKYNKIENILPYAQEQYLISYLNDSTVAFDQNGLKDELLSTLPFSHSRFAVVIIQISPTQKLFDNFSQHEYENIISGFFNIVHSIFAKSFNPFFLSVERESTYIIINTDEEYIADKLSEISSTIKDLLKQDADYMELYIATGELHENIEGLKLSHTEALKKLSGFPLVRPKTMSTVNKTTSTGFFTSDNVLALLNMLLANDVDSATEFIQKAINQCMYNDEALMQIYHRILTVIFKAMYIKNISISDNDHLEYDFYYELFNETPNMLYKRIMMFLSKFRGDMQRSDTELSDEISRMIIENYHDSSLSLDTLADALKMEKRALSAAIKKFYGINFHSYLENIRVEKAKSLLTGTNKTIQSIFEEIGFTNKQTFIRSFKKITGYTPSSYRQISDHDQ